MSANSPTVSRTASPPNRSAKQYVMNPSATGSATNPSAPNPSANWSAKTPPADPALSAASVEKEMCRCPLRSFSRKVKGIPTAASALDRFAFTMFRLGLVKLG